MIKVKKMKKSCSLDKKKYTSNSKVVSDIKKIQLKLYKETKKLLNKYDILDTSPLSEYEISLLKTENQKLQQEKKKLKEENSYLHNRIQVLECELTEARKQTRSDFSFKTEIGVGQVFENMKVGEIARNYLISALSDNRKTSDDERQKFTEKGYSENIFRLQYPLLSTNPYDHTGRRRYYAENNGTVEINGRTYYVCSQWYDYSKEDLLRWLKSHNVI